MPEEPKKNRQKGRNDPKDQRRPRQRHQPGPVENKVEKKEEESKASQKPVYEEPGPEFYKSLKRETDEILKITEEENSKYKKKEIQSNWSKYEMPMESYDDIQEQENMGADYEKLIQVPQSIGGYFQFKHEKSWDVDIDPSPYDKYFDINGDDLFLSTSTIPFYERHNIQKDIFTETDILNMNNRATRFKQKYINNKSTVNSIATSLEASDVDIDKNGKENIENGKEEEKAKKRDVIMEPTENQISLQNNNLETYEKEIQEKCPSVLVSEDTLPKTYDVEIKSSSINKNEIIQNNRKIDDDLENVDDIFSGDNEKTIDTQIKEDVIEIPKNLVANENNETETKKSPLIETPEDLEKWLDDFLDE